MASTAKKKSNEIARGFAIDGQIYCFEHILVSEAKKKADSKDCLFVVEAVNWTYAKGERKRMVHFNRYFAFSMGDALALALRIEINSADVAEEVVAIRLATPEEQILFSRASYAFEGNRATIIADDLGNE